MATGECRLSGGWMKYWVVAGEKGEDGDDKWFLYRQTDSTILTCKKKP